MTAKKPGRPPDQAPDGMITVRMTAEQIGCSYSTVYKRVKDPELGIRHTQAENGSILINLVDLDKCRPPPEAPSPRPRAYVTLQPDAERARRWQRVAGKGKRLAVWLGELADAAVERRAK